MSEGQHPQIQYGQRADGAIDVKLDGKIVGFIRLYPLGWQYKPRNGEPGDFFASLGECKDSLESE